MPKKKLYESTKTVHLDGTLHRLCKEIADKEKIAIQEVINACVREYINRKKKENFF